MSSNPRPVSRLPFLMAASVCVLLIAVALYMQYGMGLEPCPLCIFQRIAVMALAVVFVVAALVNPQGWGRRLAGLFVLLIAVLGGAVAGRQVWLQHLPEDQVPACGPGLDYMLEVLPWRKVVDLVLRGSGECAEVHWRLLGLSIAEWMVLVFAVFLLMGGYLLLRRRLLGSP